MNTESYFVATIIVCEPGGNRDKYVRHFGLHMTALPPKGAYIVSPLDTTLYRVRDVALAPLSRHNPSTANPFIFVYEATSTLASAGFYLQVEGLPEAVIEQWRLP